jgi:phenylacetate-CoA ligase
LRTGEFCGKGPGAIGQQDLSSVMSRSNASKQSAAAWDDVHQVRAFGQMLAMTEWLAPAELQSYRSSAVSRLLLHARKTTKFYKDRLDFDLSSRESIEANWSTIPLVNRAEAMRSRLKLTSHAVPVESGPVREGKTSGSTGSPLVFRKSAGSMAAATALTERMLRWWGADGSRTLAQIAPRRLREPLPPGHSSTQGWHSEHPGGLKYFMGLETDAETHLQFLMDCRPDYLGSYPAILKELARLVQKRGIDLKFALLMSFAALLDEATREACRAAFGVEIADTYGAQEVDHIAAQCPTCGEYHISADTAIVEILRADGSAAAPGEIGRVVVTSLYNYAMPFIRYEIGDMAEVGSPAPSCGRGLPTLRRILGRARQMFRFRDGSAVWPVSARFNLPEFLPHEQFQVVQTDFDHVEILYVPDGSDRPINLPALTQQVRSALRQPVEVSVRPVPQIARGEGGKYEDCVSLVPTD